MAEYDDPGSSRLLRQFKRLGVALLFTAFIALLVVYIIWDLSSL